MKEATWMNIVDFHNQFPGHRLVDKAAFQGNGNDTSPSGYKKNGPCILRVYTRRRKRNAKTVELAVF